MTSTETHRHISFRRSWNLTPETLHELGQCEALISAISNTPLILETFKRLLRVSLIKGARATTAIEGNTLSEEEISRIEEGASLPPSKQYMETEVKNILNAFNLLLVEVAVEDRTSLVNAELLLRFHQLIGLNLGGHFDAIPGRFRQDSRRVGTYRTPPHDEVPQLIDSLCRWLHQEFRYGNGQTMTEAIIQAIVTHVYIEWIHPFGDGNGRTGRLVEFYLLLRAGAPNIASHILSNHYNETRAEYYRQLDRAGRSGDLTDFIRYAVQGLRDGLAETLKALQEDQLLISWRVFIYDTFAPVRLEQRKRSVFMRQRRLILDMPTGVTLTAAEMGSASPALVREYATASDRTIARDIKLLEDLNLVRRVDKGYVANTDILKLLMPTKRKQIEAAKLAASSKRARASADLVEAINQAISVPV